MSAKMNVKLEDFDTEEDFDLFENDLDQDQEKGLIEFSKDFQENAKLIARKYIHQFFKDKEYHLGGEIPQEELFSNISISTVLNYNIEDAADKAYVALKPLLLREQKILGRLEVSCDVRIVVGTLNLMSQSCIPKQFAGGLMLLYLKFVEGIKIGL